MTTAEDGQQSGGRVDAAPAHRSPGQAGAGDGPRPAAPGQGGAPAVEVRVRYFAGAAAAAGVEEELVTVAGATLGDLRARVLDLHPPLERVLAVSTTLLDEVAVSQGATVLAHGATVDVLPPFAGG